MSIPMYYSNVRLLPRLAENKGQALESWLAWIEAWDVLVEGVQVGTLESVGWGYWGYRPEGAAEVERVDAHIHNWWKPLRALLGSDHVGRRPVTAEDWYWALALSLYPTNAPAIGYLGNSAARAFDEWAGRQSKTVPEQDRLAKARISAQSCFLMPEYEQIVADIVVRMEGDAYVQEFLNSPLRAQVRAMFLAQRQEEEGLVQVGEETAYADNSTVVTVMRPDGRKIRHMTVGPSGDRCF